MQSIQSIKKKAWWRIAMITLFMSLLLGTAQYFYQLELLDEQVIVGAENKSTTAFTLLQFVQQKGADQLPKDPDASNLLAALHQSFPVIELYGKHQHKWLESTLPEAEWIEDYLKQLGPHGFGYDLEPEYRRLSLNGSWYWQVVLPIVSAQGAIEGYFEGVYHLSADDEQDLRDTVLFSVLMVVLATLITGAVMYPLLVRLTKDLARQSQAVLQGNIELLEVMGEAIARRDADTHIHNYRVTLYAVKLAEAVHYPNDKMPALIAGSFLHDVGKIGISDAVLLKPGKLTEEEFAVMKTHVSIGEQILARANWLADARDIPLYHHEKYDGTGYMRGLKGEGIPLAARIFAIVDVFDALTAVRPYKQAMSFDEAKRIIEEGAGKHFDPRIVSVFSVHAQDWYQGVYCQPNDVIEVTLRQLVADKFVFS
ncbi:MAG: HD-GYP domain-containing protein [Proteobacteria bacterium]|nr:HD-GYP domain-containing protein [Pseudomonadota bacterium]